MSGDVVAMPKRGRARRVVFTFPLSSGALAHLSGTLGGDVELVDIREADGSEDAVLMGSTSRQLIGKIRSAFPTATVLVVEVEDPAFGVDLGGQVIRSLDAGADGYYVARSLDQLAGVVDHALGGQEDSSQQPVELSAPPEDELHSILDRLARAEPAERRTAPRKWKRW